MQAVPPSPPSGPDSGAPPAADRESLRRCTHTQLYITARDLGVEGAARMTREELVERILEAGGRAIAPKPLPPRAAAPPVPWSYGRDRVGAMAVDPDRLVCHWEATDEAIARARGELGSDDTWLAIRVHDVTGRVWDGTNAHHWFDHGVDRAARQWFFHIGRPSSEVIVELGVRARDGRFARIARSSRVVFPRRAPSPRGDVWWMTVRPHDGGIEMAPPPSPPGQPGWGAGGGAHWASAAPHEGGPPPDPREDWVRAEHVLEWSGEPYDVWEEGPFELPFAWTSPVEIRTEEGARVWHEHGRVRGVYARWEVVVRGIGARGRREVLARWEITRTFGESRGAVYGPGVGPLGASEHRWGAGSELRLQGSSERLYAGASERRLGGASEWSFGGASWFRARGASERLVRGVGSSDQRFRALGSSERARR